MPPMAQEAIHLVESEGWHDMGAKGNHRQFRHPVKPGRLTISGTLDHGLTEKAWLSILLQAGLSKDGNEESGQ